MANTNPIEMDAFYNRLSELVVLSDLNPADRVLFLSFFESCYNFHPYHTYQSITSKAIEAFEEMIHA